MTERHPWMPAQWPAPMHVHAGITTRRHGYSRPPFDSFNLAGHVGDDPAAVAGNRDRLRQMLRLPAEPVWLNQAHGTAIVDAEHSASTIADGCWTRTAGKVCTVLTADCLPLLLCDRDGHCVAAVHVGWRGLVAGVVQAAIDHMPASPDTLLAWLGPCIGPRAFEVGADVYTACRRALPGAEAAFRAIGRRHWQADLKALTRMALAQRGVNVCHASDACTYTDTDTFYSYRRDGKTGRMASLIWMEAVPA